MTQNSKKHRVNETVTTKVREVIMNRYGGREKFSEKFGLSTSTVNAWYYTGVKPTISIMYRLEKKTGLTLGDWMDHSKAVKKYNYDRTEQN